MKEREKIYFAADLIQKNYLEMHEEKGISMDQLLTNLVEKGQKINLNVSDSKDGAKQ